MTHVINIKDAPKGWMHDPKYHYIGRIRGDQSYEEAERGFDGRWGNPFILRFEKHRELILEMYEKWLHKQPFKYRQQMANYLWGKTLVCFCKPKLCHGDVIVEYVDRGYDEELRQLQES